MDATAFVVIGSAVVVVAYLALRREARLTRELISSVRYETEQLGAKVDRFMHVNQTANVLARHAVASAERAEVAAERSAERAETAGERASVVVVVPAGGEVPRGERN